ncbi:carbohydrate ABC transporter permease [Microbacterium sp. YY-01]|uniref:carbohydrate ABC transporter permease n=1 Tax=Microbacterium sp. YY-01 TaxID=3421634 RepID=UPI003D16EA28
MTIIAPDVDNTATLLSAPAPERGIRFSSRSRRVFRRTWVALAITLLLVIEIYPMFWLFMSSFKTTAEFTQGESWALPQQWTFDNYTRAWTEGQIGANLLNSVIVTVPSLIMVLLLGVGAAFALEVMVWKGRSLALLMFVSGIMIPGQMILIPLFIAYFRLNLTDTYWPMILTYVGLGLPLTVFMMAAYFRAVPREVFEAATIDGAGMVRSFFTIGIPLVKNALFTIGLVQFLAIWNDLLVSLTFSTNSKLRTIQAGLLNFSGEYGVVDYGPLFAGISINVFTLLILFLVLNRQIMQGLASGALKG